MFFTLEEGLCGQKELPLGHLGSQSRTKVTPFVFPCRPSHRHTFPRCIFLMGLFQGCAVCLATQSCLTLCDPMNCSPPGSSVHEILQARILEWVVMPASRGSSQPRDQTQASPIAGRFFAIWAIREAQEWSRLTHAKSLEQCLDPHQCAVTVSSY